jgi:hypothetical protein
MNDNSIKYVYTVEAVAELTGYSVGTIQDFSSRNTIPRPKQWLDPSIGRKGLYPIEAVEMLNHYRQLMSLGRGKDWVLARMSERMAEFNQRLAIMEEAIVCQ